MEQFDSLLDNTPAALRGPTKQPLVGIGGWLLVFCATNVLGACVLLFAILKSHNTHDRLVDALIVATTLLMLALVVKRSPIAVLAAQIAIGTRLAVNCDNVRIAWDLYQKHPRLQQVATNIAVRQIAPALTAAVWLIYFARSRRVRETFGKHDAESDAPVAPQP